MEPRNRGGVSFLIALALSGTLFAACEGDASPPAQRPPEAPAPRPTSRSASPAGAGSGSEPPPPQPPAGAPGERVTRTFQLSILSRGSGVPAAAKEAAQQVQKLVDADRARGIRVTVETTRIGIEGERRMCVTYQNAREGGRMFERVRALVKGVDLVNLVEGPCTTSPAASPKKEEPS